MNGMGASQAFGSGFGSDGVGYVNEMACIGW